jgi:hypothetical protein
VTRIIIAGSRNFTDYALLKQTMNALTFRLGSVVVLSGHAEGADQLGEQWAQEWYYAYEIYRPDYDLYGKKEAPLRRNEEMAKNADCCVCFHADNSPGTGHMIATAEKHGLKLRVIKVKGKT